MKFASSSIIQRFRLNKDCDRLKKGDKLNRSTFLNSKDQNQKERIDGDNIDGKYERTEIWTETSPKLRDSDNDGLRVLWEFQKGYNPLSDDTDKGYCNEDYFNWARGDYRESHPEKIISSYPQIYKEEIFRNIEVK